MASLGELDLGASHCFLDDEGLVRVLSKALTRLPCPRLLRLFKLCSERVDRLH
jgi:hypothetical protein